MVDRSLDADQLYDLAVNEDGSLNVPSEVLQYAGFRPGDSIRVVLVGGELKLMPVRFVVSQVAAEISQMMTEEGVTLEDLLEGLDEAGDEVFRDTYGDAASG